MKPSEMRKPPARAIAFRSGTAQWCSIRSRAAAESLGMSSMMSQASSSSKALMPSAAAWAPASAPSSRPSSPSMPEADQGADLAAELDRLVLGEVAQVEHLDLALGVLVHRQRIDHAHGVALAQALELLDDLAVEVGVLEAQHDQLDGSDGHVSSSLCRWVRLGRRERLRLGNAARSGDHSRLLATEEASEDRTAPAWVLRALLRITRGTGRALTHGVDTRPGRRGGRLRNRPRSPELVPACLGHSAVMATLLAQLVRHAGEATVSQQGRGSHPVVGDASPERRWGWPGERTARGRAARSEVPRSRQAEFKPGESVSRRSSVVPVARGTRGRCSACSRVGWRWSVSSTAWRVIGERRPGDVFGDTSAAPITPRG